MRVNWRRIEAGLPDRFFLRRYAIIAGILAAGLFLFASDIRREVKRYFNEEPTSAPICYWPEHSDFLPGNARVRVFNVKPTWPAQMDDEMSRLLDAAAACPPATCDANARKIYLRRFSAFMGNWLWRMRNIYEDNGEAGLEFVRAELNTPRHLAIHSDFVKRHELGWLRLKDFDHSLDGFAAYRYRSMRPCTSLDVPGARSTAL